MQRKDLAKLAWTLAGWEPNAWRLRRSMETDVNLRPEIGPGPARVPGSVQAALLAAGLLPDWNQGMTTSKKPTSKKIVKKDKPCNYNTMK